MLDAACPGNVFAAPPADFVYNTTKLVASPKGVLHLLNNYTGDTMSFEMGREMAEAEGINIRTVTINDDVAVKDSTWTIGRRGVAGNFFVIKATGAAAEKGASLEDLEKLGNRVVANVRTMGMALTGCTPPAKGTPIFTLADDEMEMGIGIHGEPGRQRTGLLDAREITTRMTEAILADLPFRTGESVIAMVNGMGGTPLMELYLVYQELERVLRGRGIAVARRLVGNYITSLDMAGCSITLLRVEDEFLALWDDPVLTPALRWKA
jgi:dihydroxyacetone kinase-like protein